RGPVQVRLGLGCRRLPDADSANVVGDVRGREKPDEVVLLGAHLDSWDLGQGAVDDAAGVAVVMEAARLIAQLPQRPRRTVLAGFRVPSVGVPQDVSRYFDYHHSAADTLDKVRPGDLAQTAAAVAWVAYALAEMPQALPRPAAPAGRPAGGRP